MYSPYPRIQKKKQNTKKFFEQEFARLTFPHVFFKKMNMFLESLVYYLFSCPLFLILVTHHTW